MADMLNRQAQLLSNHLPFNAPIAQLAEQDTLNVKVGGSIPSERTTLVTASGS